MKHLLAIAVLAIATPAFADPPAAKKPVCTDAEFQKHKADGTQQLSDGQDAAALVSYEKAYACKADAALLPRMVLASCKSKNEKKAKLYYGQCGNACSTLALRCETYNIKLK